MTRRREGINYIDGLLAVADEPETFALQLDPVVVRVTLWHHV
jgi:hypothetical protein